MDSERWDMREACKRDKRNQLVAEELFKVLQNNQLSLLDTEDVFAKLEHIIKNRIHM